ncbi:MASE3 domain-containing protein [Clostridium saccharobutylicum]|uniref:histidine kinase n=1 Tax=Clostridium saccharobutylicum DSM 13864 TaxID=1345695 RepID=U5MTV5_CLOSA|nr:MASE3 domain-containing protein [Clostridium saccharobutylicum]AGX44229.1 alkaline phosphatase synthesis sensor protein PhoR [Clostridium saccharobutylicum DSM 13864]AQR91518.1 alkaline phosphatase synthesis sensor protein PhoR [Clostridium saccharobutylicum]AQS01423.1 alkaline phosphatase synthesis sensor protein PhoR [Clostridium saccharobutylicum]AQS11032.1 alkaline phosphatase synthesis sensor protein PhoR [Clostridium saccharobutylicum]AQS15406.1 alkaline phosphatase synthesis sensor p
MSGYQKKILQTIIVLFIAVVLYLTSLYDYLLFHSFAELFSITIGFTLFVIAWNSRNFSQQHFDYLIFIGIVYMFGSFLDLLHTLSYNGMNIFKDYRFYANQLCTGARYLESISLLVPFICMHFKKHLRPYLIFIIYTIITSTIIASIFYFKVFPICFIDGKGQTQFKIISEYLICLILILDAILLIKNKHKFDGKVYKYLFWSLVFAIVSELEFTLYISSYGFSNLLGHYFKILSFYFIYKAVVVTCITEPYQTIFKELIYKEKSINDQKEELEAIMENMSDELIICDKNGEPTMINKALKKQPFFNCTELTNLKNTLKEFKYFDIDGNLISFKNLPLLRVGRGERISNYRIDCKTNNYIVHREVSGTPIYDNEGNFIAGVMVGRDIGDRLKNEENLLLKAQYDLLNRTIENLDLSYEIISYPDFKIKYMNSKCYNDLKQINQNIISLSCSIGKNIFEVFKFNMDEKAEVLSNIKYLIEKNRNYYFLNRKHIMAGEEKFFRVIFQPLFDINKKISEIVVIAIDITEETKAKNKIEEVLKIQDEIFANVSHELKTPLNVIFSTNQLMELYSRDDSLEDNKEKISKSINIIKQNCYRFTKLINNIVDISKMNSGFFKLNLSNENIVEIIEDIVQSVSEYIKGKGLNIIFDTNTEEKIIAFDPEKIERIILNLISNAIKFTNLGGMIFIELIDKGDTIEILVKDTGIGMDKKHLNNIFKRFHQIDKSLSRNAEGSGIGLSLVKSLVKLHGGKISVDSEVGKGSTFKIELPAKTIEDVEVIDKIKPTNNKIEMINIEFSDIYSI